MTMTTVNSKAEATPEFENAHLTLPSEVHFHTRPVAICKQIWDKPQEYNFFWLLYANNEKIPKAETRDK